MFVYGMEWNEMECYTMYTTNAFHSISIFYFYTQTYTYVYKCIYTHNNS